MDGGSQVSAGSGSRRMSQMAAHLVDHGPLAFRDPLGVGQRVRTGAAQLALHERLATRPRTVVVHGQDIAEHLAIPLGVMRGLHEHADDGRAHQDQRLAAPPMSGLPRCLSD
jgi:hypothetical protein